MIWHTVHEAAHECQIPLENLSEWEYPLHLVDRRTLFRLHIGIPLIVTPFCVTLWKMINNADVMIVINKMYMVVLKTVD